MQVYYSWILHHPLCHEFSELRKLTSLVNLPGLAQMFAHLRYNTHRTGGAIKLGLEAFALE